MAFFFDFIFLSADTISYSLWLNFDNPLIAIGFLWFLKNGEQKSMRDSLKSLGNYFCFIWSGPLSRGPEICSSLYFSRFFLWTHLSKNEKNWFLYCTTLLDKYVTYPFILLPTFKVIRQEKLNKSLHFVRADGGSAIAAHRTPVHALICH